MTGPQSTQNDKFKQVGFSHYEWYSMTELSGFDPRWAMESLHVMQRGIGVIRTIEKEYYFGS